MRRSMPRLLQHERLLERKIPVEVTVDLRLLDHEVVKLHEQLLVHLTAFLPKLIQGNLGREAWQIVKCGSQNLGGNVILDGRKAHRAIDRDDTVTVPEKLTERVIMDVMHAIAHIEARSLSPDVVPVTVIAPIT